MLVLNHCVKKKDIVTRKGSGTLRHGLQTMKTAACRMWHSTGVRAAMA